MSDTKSKSIPGPVKRFHERFETRLTEEESAALYSLAEHLTAVNREPYDKSKAMRFLLKWSGDARFREMLLQLEFETTII